MILEDLYNLCIVHRKRAPYDSPFLAFSFSTLDNFFMNITDVRNSFAYVQDVCIAGQNYDFKVLFLLAEFTMMLLEKLLHFSLIVTLGVTALHAQTGLYRLAHSTVFTVSQKSPHLKLSVTLSNVNRFSKFLHC